MPYVKGTPEERFWLSVDRRGPDECWPWSKSTNPSDGYGYIRVTGKPVAAHRFSYELHVAPIADGLHVDHMCHNADLSCPGGLACLHRRCVNPAHLDPVPQGENNRRAHQRKSTCPQGHPRTPENRISSSSPNKTRCRLCHRDQERNRKLQRAGTS